MTQAFGLKQVVSQLPFARFSSACALFLRDCLMPRKTLEEVKAYEIEQLRLRTKRNEISSVKARVVRTRAF
jgi:hypothetical protein